MSKERKLDPFTWRGPANDTHDLVDHGPRRLSAVARDLAEDLLPIVIDPASARAAATAVQLNPDEIARASDAAVQRLFDAIGAHATDDLSLAVLRGLLPRLGLIALDPDVTTAEWRTPARVREALARWRTSAAELRSRMQTASRPVSTERFLVDLDARA